MVALGKSDVLCRDWLLFLCNDRKIVIFCIECDTIDVLRYPMHSLSMAETAKYNNVNGWNEI